MKKVRIVWLIAAMFLISYAAAQAPSSSYAQLKANRNKSVVGNSKSVDSCRMALAAKKAADTPEKSVSNGSSKVSVGPDSQPNSLTQQMVEETASEMSEQARISAENSIHELIEKSFVENSRNVDTLNALKPVQSTF